MYIEKEIGPTRICCFDAVLAEIEKVDADFPCHIATFLGDQGKKPFVFGKDDEVLPLLSPAKGKEVFCIFIGIDDTPMRLYALFVEPKELDVSQISTAIIVEAFSDEMFEDFPPTYRIRESFFPD